MVFNLSYESPCFTLPVASDINLSSMSESNISARLLTQEVPFGLKKLSRTPEDILKARRSSMDVNNNSLQSFSDESIIKSEDPWIEWEIKWKLYYIETIQNLSSRTIGSRSTELFEDVCVLERLLSVEMNVIQQLENDRKQLLGQMEFIRQDQEYVLARMEENDLLTIAAINNCQKKIADMNLKVDTRNVLHSRVFYPGMLTTSPLPDLTRPPPSLPCVKFNNLSVVPGWLAEHCQEEHGSNWVIEQLKMCNQMERSLVIQELGLPGNLINCLTNKHCRNVVKTLIEVDNDFKRVIVQQALRDQRKISQLDIEEGYMNTLLF